MDTFILKYLITTAAATISAPTIMTPPVMAPPIMAKRSLEELETQ